MSGLMLGASDFFAIYLMIAGWLTAALVGLRCDRVTISLFLTAAALSAARLVLLTPEALTSDLGGHVGYIRYIADNAHLPPPWGWHIQQPPLFYSLAAVGYSGAEALGLDPRYGARYVAAFLYYGFAISAMLSLRLILRRPVVYYLSLALLLFWPSASHVSVKINNDLGTACFAMLCFYGLLRWLKKDDAKYLSLALAASGLALACKGSGIVTVAMIVAAFLHRFIAKKPIPWRHSVLSLGLIVFMLGAGANFGRTLYYQLREHHPPLNWLINRHDDLSKNWDYVGNQWTDFVWFDARDFVATPFVNFVGTVPQARLFWNISLKTLLLDDYWHKGEQTVRIMNAAWLLMIGWITGLSLWAWRRKLMDGPLFLAVAAIVLAFAMLMAGRIAVPVSFQCSGRYIYFTVGVIALLYGMLLERWMALKADWVRFVPLLPGIGLLLLSLLFTVAQFS